MIEDVSSYADKCRCCFAIIDTEDGAVLITKVTEKQFLYVSSVELKSSPLLSTRVCKGCHHQLASFYYFKQDLVTKQETLYELLEEQKITTEIEKLHENASFGYEDIKTPKADETDLNIKIESGIEEEFRISEVFESIDYDLNTTENLNYDTYENHSTHVYSSATRNRSKKDPFGESVKFGKNRHRKLNETVKNHPCPVCPKNFNSKKKVKLHVQRVHKQIKDHKCDECEYRAHTKYDILRHIKANHMPPEPDPKDLRICPDCGKVLKGNNHLNFHIKTKHLKLTKYSCDLCDFRSYGKYEIRSHIEIHHLPLELRKGFPCDLCSSVLTTAMSLKTHKTHKHSGLRPHQCYCGKAYPLRETLKSHIRNVHNGERKYKCGSCEKGFNSNPRLRDHINNVHGTKQEIPCDKCGKIFNSLRNLQTHMIYHQSPSLKCNYCEKVFFIKKNLREHQESVHLGITYSCDLCNRSFQSTSGLRRHSKSHSK